jgi:hypothetical protein
VQDSDAAEVEGHVRGYIERWNAKDTASIWANFYRLDASNRIKTADDLQAIFDGLVAEGFDHTVLGGVETQKLGPDEYLARVRFTRFTTGGAVMAPGERGCDYRLRRFPDGLRITAVLATP